MNTVERILTDDRLVVARQSCLLDAQARKHFIYSTRACLNQPLRLDSNAESGCRPTWTSRRGGLRIQSILKGREHTNYHITGLSSVNNRISVSMFHAQVTIFAEFTSFGDNALSLSFSTIERMTRLVFCYFSEKTLSWLTSPTRISLLIFECHLLLLLYVLTYKHNSGHGSTFASSHSKRLTGHYCAVTGKSGRQSLAAFTFALHVCVCIKTQL